jgi:hypothetical protein
MNQTGLFVLSVLLGIYSLLNSQFLCHFGQNLIDSGDLFFSESYECNWVEQTIKFRKSFIIMREFAKNSLHIQIAGGWILERSLILVVSDSPVEYIRK